jgi:predicted lysophospholipase L1 biosynthesis ABC-type transport system permease subunit
VLTLWPRLAQDLLLGGLAERTRCRPIRSPNRPAMLDTLLQDLRFARRSLSRRPALTGLAISTLALGIAASVSMFSVVDGVMLRPLPYPDSGRLTAVYTTIPEWRENPALSAFWERTKGGAEHFTGHGGHVMPWLLDETRGVRYPLLILMAAVLLLLVVARANVATFLLGRAVDRQQEIAVRGALGAGGTRIARQLVTESLLLSAAGGALGLLLAAPGVRALTFLAPPDLPRLDAVGCVPANDPTTLATIAALVAGMAALAALAPSLRASRVDPVRALRAE